MIVLRVLAFAAGVALVFVTVLSAVQTVVVPRAVSSFVTRAVFISIRRLFAVAAPPRKEFAARDRILAYYAPVSLLVLPVVWVAMIILGYTLLFWSVGAGDPWQAFTESGSSMLTLGFIPPSGTGEVILAFTEATLGLGMVALLISYLPSIYGSFGRREQLVGQLEVRAGIPPSPAELLVRYHRIGLLEAIDTELFARWEQWFIDVEESHTSLPALVFFRSPQPARSWVTAAGCVLDTASIMHSTVDRPRAPSTAVMIRTGFLTLRRIADYFAIDYPADVDQNTPISVTRSEWEQLCEQLTEAGVPLKADRDQAWRDFTGWRANYDGVLLALATLVVAPPAKWSSDRALLQPVKPKAFGRRRAV